MKFKSGKIFLTWAVFTATIVGLLLLFPTFSVYGTKADEKVFISEFDDSTDGFFSEDRSHTLNKAQITDEKGNLHSCLEVKSKKIPITALRTVKKQMAAPYDFTSYRKIAYSIFVPSYSDDGAAVYYARFSIYSTEGRVFESLETVTGGEWNNLELDISGWSGRSSISDIEITFTVDTSLSRIVSDSFYVDDIYAFDSIDAEMVERFLFDSYSLTGGSVALAKDKSYISLFSDSTSSMRFSASLLLPTFDYDVNCLRINLANYTDNDYLTLYYSTVDERAVSENKSVIVPIVPNSDEQYYYIYIEDAEQIRNIDLLFGSNYGSVRISSVAVIAAYQPKDYDTCGEITVCNLNSDLSGIHFAGEINRETALSNSGEKIKIYSIGEGELPTRQGLDEMTPVVEGAVTAKFDLTWYIPKNTELSLLERYIAVIAPDGEDYLLIDAPTYVENPEIFAEVSHKFPTDAKGYYTDDLSLIGDSYAGITILEVDMANVFSENPDEKQYMYNGEIYYLNREYIENISRKIEAFKNANVSVLVRLTNPPYRMSGADAKNDSNSENQSTAIRGKDYIGAISWYISKNFVKEGSVCGIILGYGENYIEAGQDFGRIIAGGAASLKKISANLLKCNSDARAYISVTDLFFSVNATSSAEIASAEYLKALLGEIGRHGDFPLGICVESTFRQTLNFGDVCVAVDDYAPLESLINEYGNVKYNFIFCDNVYTSKTSYLGNLIETYVKGYYSALFDERVDGYIAVSAGKFTGLAQAVKNIDTVNSDNIVKTALAMMGVEDLSDVIDGFVSSKLSKYKVSEGKVSYAYPENLRGSCALLNFGSMPNTEGVNPSYYGESLKIFNDEAKGNVLLVKLEQEVNHQDGYFTSPSWFGVTIPFEHTENLDFMPWISVQIKIGKNAGAAHEKVPVKLMLSSADERFEAIAEISAGEWQTVYFDINDFHGAKDTLSMKILVGESEAAVEEFSVKEIRGYSYDYNDDSLENLVKEERQKKSSSDKNEDYSAYIWMGGVALIAVATVVAFAMLSRKKERGG